MVYLNAAKLHIVTQMVPSKVYELVVFGFDRVLGIVNCTLTVSIKRRGMCWLCGAHIVDEFL